MVYNRLQFLSHTNENEEVIKAFVWEIMNELEPCFKVGDANIGDESKYTMVMQSIIADLVASYILLGVVGVNSQGSSSGSLPSVRYLKRTKAGSAEVEWGQISVKDSNVLFISADRLMTYYKADAAKKARGLGCILDICDDCTATLDGVTGALPSITISSCGCGC